MRRGASGFVVFAAVAGLVLGTAGATGCRKSGSGSGAAGSSGSAFPQGFFPVRQAVAGGSGDVSFQFGGDAYAVVGTADVLRISRTDGSVSTFSASVGGGATTLLSVEVGPGGRIFAGDDAGNIYSIDTLGVSSLLVATGAAGITGMTIAPTGFGDFGGSIIAAGGASGLFRVSTGEGAASNPLATPGDTYVDVAFSGGTLFALDATNDEIDTVSATGTVTSFQGGLTDPVGMAVDTAAGEIWIADAGVDALLVVPVAGGAPAVVAPYDFDVNAPSGVDTDGIGALGWVTRGSVVLRGSALPRIDPTNPNYGLAFSSTTVGYGDLEFDRNGAFVGVANDEDDPGDPGDSIGNFVFRVSRDGGTLTRLATNVGAVGEDLLSLASDPVTGTLYVGSVFGNVYAIDSANTVSLLVDAAPPTDAVLGLELAPAGFGAFGGHLVATTSEGEVLAIDPASPVPVVLIALIEKAPGDGARLSDLVFSSDGTLYVLDNGAADLVANEGARILEVTPGGGVFDLGANPAELDRPDGIEIDEGGDRLLVVTDRGAFDDQLLEVTLGGPVVTALATLIVDDGFFPSGIVYDRLGSAVVHSGETFTFLDAADVVP